MNLLRFKAPALIELNTPSAAPGQFTIPLTRFIRVVNAFGYAAEAAEDSTFSLFALGHGTRYEITKPTPLLKSTTTYITELDPEMTTLSAGWTLGVDIQGAAKAHVYIWVIPLPTPA